MDCVHFGFDAQLVYNFFFFYKMIICLAYCFINATGLLHVFKCFDLYLIYFTVFSVLECASHAQCPTSLSCLNGRCQNPCSSHYCSANQACRVLLHQPVCHEGKFEWFDTVLNNFGSVLIKFCLANRVPWLWALPTRRTVWSNYGGVHQR